MQNKKILVIGASGFVGTRLIEEVGPERCINLDKNPSFFFPELSRKVDIRSENLNHDIPQNTEVVVLLAAEHRDDVSPASIYYEVNVEGTKNVLKAMDEKGINNIIFTSSVAVYGLNKQNPDEKHPVDPFNHYGKSKWQAEEVLREWYQNDPDNRSLTIIRPTVIFGERNRGNVYNLLNQIASGKFLMIGKGTNKKSMAYVGNVVAFIKYCMERQVPGYRLYNYTDQPDNSMNELVNEVENTLQKKLPTLRIPYSLGYTGALFFDILARLTNKKFPVSAIRVKKFCATTQFNSTAAHASGFKAPHTLKQALHQTLHYEFLNSNKDNQVFYSE